MKRKIPEIFAGDRRKVVSMRAHGMSLKLIAKRIGCSIEELERWYARELERALPEMKAKVGGSLFAAAQSGDIRAIIFWLKTRARWRESDRKDVAEVVISPDPRPYYPPVILPCNGRALCAKIANPVDRHAAYELALGRKLPGFDPSACPKVLTREERDRFWELAIATVERSPSWKNRRR